MTIVGEQEYLQPPCHGSQLISTIFSVSSKTFAESCRDKVAAAARWLQTPLLSHIFRQSTHNKPSTCMSSTLEMRAKQGHASCHSAAPSRARLNRNRADQGLGHQASMMPRCPSIHKLCMNMPLSRNHNKNPATQLQQACACDMVKIMHRQGVDCSTQVTHQAPAPDGKCC